MTETVNSVKQHRVTLSKCFDFLVVRQVVAGNPAAVVAAPKLKVSKGRTATLTDDECQDLLEVIPTDPLVGQRDRTLLCLLAYTWQRI